VIGLETGRITQKGTHEELMRRDGHYRDIAAVQLYGDQLDGNDSEPASAGNRLREACEAAAPSATAGDLKTTGNAKQRQAR